MSRYTFTFKKDDVFVEFTTEDKDVVERQFQIWVADADDYARHSKLKQRSEKQNASDVVQNVEQKEDAPQFNEPEEKKTEVQPEPQPEPIVAEQPVVENTQAFDQASSLLKTINSIQNGDKTPEEPQAPSVDFESVLEKSIETSTFEPDRARDQVFLNLIKSKNTTDKFHYLIITAYYLTEFEKFERFSLKQINAKLMQNLSEVIDSGTLQEAMTQNFIELVPDLTGISEVGEYKLTRDGEEFFANKI